MAKKISKIEDLTPDAANANKGNERGIYMVETSIEKLGAGRSIVVDRDGNVIAGNKTLQAAIEKGFDIEVVTTDGKKLVVVQREDLDLNDPDGMARQLAYADNRASEVGLEWDVDRLVSDLAIGVELDDWFLSDELDALIGVLETDSPQDAGAQVDRAAELQDVWNVERGQVWEIPSQTVEGKRHRVMCGDSTSAEDVGRLMGGEKADAVVTDPPYGVDYERGKFDGTPRKSGMPTSIQNDNFKREEQQAFIRDAFNAAKTSAIGNAVIYMFSAPLAEGCYSMFGLLDTGAKVQSQLIWNKSSLVLGRADYQWKHEIVWYGFWENGESRVWNGGRDQTTVIDASKISASFHPNEKPVALLAYFLKNSTNRLGKNLDIFMGSGSSIVACEQTGRVGYGIEIEPKYVAVTLQRLSDMGLNPVKVEG